MHTREWIRDVFVGTGRIQRLYFFGSTFPLAVIGVLAGKVPYLATHLPMFVRMAPACALLVGFLRSNVAAYSQQRDRADAAEAKLDGFAVDLLEAAGDLCTRADTATLQLGFRVAARSRSQVGRTLELESCVVEIAPQESRECDRLIFAEGADYNGSRDLSCRVLDAGAIRKLKVRADYELPASVTTNEFVTGILKLADNHGQSRSIPFRIQVQRRSTGEPTTAHIFEYRTVSSWMRPRGG